MDNTSLDDIVSPGYSGTLGRKSSFHKPEPIYDNPADIPLMQPLLHHSRSSPGSPSGPSVQHYAVSPMSKGGKKPPPPPPKRTNSIKMDGPGPYFEKNLHGSAGSDNSPSSPAPGATQEPFASCVKSLADRFSGTDISSAAASSVPHTDSSGVTLRKHLTEGSSQKDDGRRDSCSSEMSLPEAPHEYTPPEEEDFPPPPPPLLAQTPTKAYSTYTDSENPLSEVIERLEGKTPTSSASGSDTTLASKRNESSSSLDSNISISSTDLNTLPFANENVGTIKQRNPSSKPSIVTVSSEGDEQSSEKNIELNSSLFEDNTGTIKRKGPSSSASPHPMAQVQPVQRGNLNFLPFIILLKKKTLKKKLFVFVVALVQISFCFAVLCLMPLTVIGSIIKM